jgi:sialate O-acetylesterase
MTVKGKNTIDVKNILVGEVWGCSGQSNMEFGMSGAHDASVEIPKANYPKIRLFTVKKHVAFEPQADCEGEWAECTPDTVKGFTAVGYFFGRDIHQALDLPVGLIHTSWGGTPAQAWTSIEKLKSIPELSYYADDFQKLAQNLPAAKEKFETQDLPKWEASDKKWKETEGKVFADQMKAFNAAAQAARAAGQPEPARPVPSHAEPRRPNSPDQNPNTGSVLYNGMIAPIIPFGIRGFIWYQGESNSGKAVEYRTLFPAMISDWRERWGEGNFTFLWVQLANFMARTPGPTQTSAGWPGLREAQSMTLSLPNTGQAVIIDIGMADNIHPKDKLDVGHRLALAAEKVAYGKDIVYSGPTYDSMTVEGDKVRIKFKNVGGGLIIGSAPPIVLGATQEAPASELKGFSIAGADKNFVWADAKIDGDSIVVSSDKVKEPKAVRYGWANNPEVNLYNKEGLPASPFRTDTWADPEPTRK